jgi:hypothetical protein
VADLEDDVVGSDRGPRAERAVRRGGPPRRAPAAPR